MTRAEALAGMAWMILKKFPTERQQEILNDPDLLAELIAAVERVADETHKGAKLNNLSLDEYMQIVKKMRGGGNA